MKNRIALILVVCLVFSIIMPVSAIAESRPNVTVNFTDTGSIVNISGTDYPVWKMVVGTGASTGIQVLGAVFSMDKSLIKPVEENDNLEFIVSDIIFSATNPLDSGSLVTTGKYGSKASNYYTSSPDLWLDDGTNNTMAFSYGVFTTETINANYYNNSSMFEFYFALTGTPYKGCIKLETETDPGSYINRFSKDIVSDQYGIYIKSA